jgi:hypothetical protein
MPEKSVLPSFYCERSNAALVPFLQDLFGAQGVREPELIGMFGLGHFPRRIQILSNHFCE